MSPYTKRDEEIETGWFGAKRRCRLPYKMRCELCDICSADGLISEISVRL